jgi:hypothetical protein
MDFFSKGDSNGRLAGNPDVRSADVLANQSNNAAIT